MNSVVGAYVRTDLQKFEVVINSPSGLQHLMVDRNLLAGNAEEQIKQFREIAKETYIGERVEVYLDDTGQFVEVVPRLPTEEALSQGAPIPESVEKLVFTDTNETPFDEIPPVKLNKLAPDAKEKSVKITRPTSTSSTSLQEGTATPKPKAGGRKSLLSISKAKSVQPSESVESEKTAAPEKEAVPAVSNSIATQLRRTSDETPAKSVAENTTANTTPAPAPEETLAIDNTLPEMVSEFVTISESSLEEDTLELRKFCVSAVVQSKVQTPTELVSAAEGLLKFLLKLEKTTARSR